MRQIFLPAALAMFTLLGACAVTVTPAVRSTGASPAATGAAAAASPVLARATAGQGFDQILNTTRAARGLSAATEHPLLTAAAQGHAQDMASYGYLAHQGRDGSDHMARIRATGYCTGYAVENLAWDWPTVDRAGLEWTRSAKHLENMLLSGNVEYGLGVAGDRYVLVVARPC